MTKPNSSDPLKDEQKDRFRAITTEQADEESLPPQEPAHRSLLDRLPRAAKSASPPPETPRRLPAQRASRVVNPLDETGSGRTSRKTRFGPAFWTVTGILSLAVNAVLIALVLILWGQVSEMKTMLSTVTDLKSLPLHTVRGLYENFEAMEVAHIRTEIPVSTTVLVKLDVCIKTGTQVVLNQDVTIPNAKVTVQTGGLNISNAPTSILLPANTTLPVNLDLCVPVETTIPISLNVNVDIPLVDTDLNVPFTGLQDVIAPLYCLLDPKAVDSDGILICEKAKTP
jgi:hypothetical protein